MPRNKETAPKQESRTRKGPHLVAALLCEKVIEGSDGILHAVGLIDQLTRLELLGSTAVS